MKQESANIDATILKKAPIASACFMGLGQMLFLKQYIRGAVFMLAELIMLFFMFFSFESMSFGLGPILESLVGLITLGDPHPELPVKERDHSIFMMITGLIVVIICVLYIVFYLFNIKDAKRSAKIAIEKNRFPSMQEVRNDFSEKAFPYCGIVPAIVLIAFFTIVPLLFSALVAFTNYSSPDHIPPANTVDWVGFENFVTMFNPNAYGAGITNQWFGAFGRVALWTVLWAFLSTVTCYFVGMLFAVLLRDTRVKVPAFFRTVFILPYAIPSMLSLFIWANLLNGTFGPINRTLIELGILEKGIPWLSDPTMAKLTLVIVNIWLGFPYSMILITSNMTAIPGQIYEAATIDGANKWQQFAKVTLPLVLYQTMPVLIMQFANNINNFGAVFFLTGGNPSLPDTITTQAGATDLFVSWIYKLTYNTPNMYNLASVLSILVFVVLVPFAVYNFTHTKSFKEGEI